MNIDNMKHSDRYCVYQIFEFFIIWANGNCPEFLIEINEAGILIKCVKDKTILFKCNNIESAEMVLQAFMHGRNINKGDV